MNATPDSTLANPEQLIADLQHQLAEREAELAECKAERDAALEQQTATAEVLQVINSSPGDLAPVFDAILEKAHSLCDVAHGSLWIYDGEYFHPTAVHGDQRFVEWVRQRGAVPAVPGTPFAGITLGEPFVQVIDATADLAYTASSRFRQLIDSGGIRTLLAIALRRDGELLGIIVAYLQEVCPFSDKQIALLQNFAAQAVIAMENARLITETREALEQQTATAEVLQVINSSPGDLTPVFDAMLEKATRLCEAPFGILRTWDGERFHLGAVHGDEPRYRDWAQQRGAIRADRDASSVLGAQEPKVRRLFAGGSQIRTAGPTPNGTAARASRLFRKIGTGSSNPLRSSEESCKPSVPDFAQHYAEAGLVEKSVTYWGKAGRKSVAHSAMAEAAAQFQKGLDQLALLPDDPKRQRQELEFCSALGAVVRSVKGNAAPETGHAFARARELWEQLGSPSEFLHVPYGQSRYHVYRGELDLALRLDEELLRLSRQRNDSAGLVLGHTTYGLNLLSDGKLALARSHFEDALALCDTTSPQLLIHQAGVHLHGSAHSFLGIVLFCLGFPDQALARSSAAIAEARRLDHPPTLASSLTGNARLLALVGDDIGLDQRADQLLAVATEQGFPLWHALGTIFRGWVKVKNGDVAEGMSLMRNGRAACRATGTEGNMTAFIALLARASEIAGQVGEAMTQLHNALQIVERTGERWLAAELYRHKGQLLLRQGHSDAAEELYRKALSIAEAHDAKLWELRAAVSLARLWGEQGRRVKARDLLAPVYDWFNEGFDTADLKEAKVLIEELA